MQWTSVLIARPSSSSVSGIRMEAINGQEGYILKFFRRGIEKWDWVGKEEGRLTERLDELRQRGELPVFVSQ